MFLYEQESHHIKVDNIYIKIILRPKFINIHSIKPAVDLSYRDLNGQTKNRYYFIIMLAVVPL